MHLSGAMRRVAVGLCAAALATAGTMGISAGPASAATACYPNTKTIALPGKPDVKVTVDTCVQSDGDYYRPYVKIRWDGTSGFIGGTRFNSFAVSYRLERYDSTKTVFSCDKTSAINGHESGSTACYGYRWHHSTDSGGWTADGKVLYDVANDGNSTYTWQLHGSPAIP
jgi:hypothetical protein